MATNFTKINTSSNDLNRVQDNIDSSLTPLLQDSFNQGTIVEGIKLLPNQDNIINHKLGKKYTGWIIIRKKAFADIMEVISKTPNLTLILRSTDEVLVDIRIF